MYLFSNIIDALGMISQSVDFITRINHFHIASRLSHKNSPMIFMK